MSEKTEIKAKTKKERPSSTWCVMLAHDNLYIIGGYRPLAVELLKVIVPGGARRFYRTVGPEFFAQFGLSETQIEWLCEARFFSGVWEVLHEYRRALLDALSLEYPEVWVVEEGESQPYQLPAGAAHSEAEQYALGPALVMPLTWARSYTLYCHRHRTWEVQPCKEAGVIAEIQPPAIDGQPPKKKKWPDLELHAPKNTLVRATRQQVSYYLAAEKEPVRLGRDEAGETVARRVIQAQHLALLLRVARTMTVGTSDE